jgi:hypothetical protein
MLRSFVFEAGWTVAVCLPPIDDQIYDDEMIEERQ